MIVIYKIKEVKEMKKLIIGLLALWSIASFAKTNNYNCKTIQSIDPQPDMQLTLKTVFFQFEPTRINGQRVRATSHNVQNYYAIKSITSKYGVDEDIVNFMKDSKLGMFYREINSSKVYMFNHSFPWADMGDYAFLVIKDGKKYSFYDCRYL